MIDMEVSKMPTVYVRKDLYDRLVKMGMNPTVYVNDILDKSFTVTVQYNPPMVMKDEQVEITTPTKTTTKKVKKDG